eukprot:13392-Heterococcus_DN1.PRE.2
MLCTSLRAVAVMPLTSLTYAANMHAACSAAEIWTRRDACRVLASLCYCCYYYFYNSKLVAPPLAHAL